MDERKTELWLIGGLSAVVVLAATVMLALGRADFAQWLTAMQWLLGGAVSYGGMRTGKKVAEAFATAARPKEEP